MPRPPKSKNEHNPLNQLRKALGKDKEHPIFQADLGKILGISPETIKSIEAGRRKMSKAMREKIALYCGAAWDEETWRWVFLFTREPYSRQHYDAWQKPYSDREMEIHALCLQMLVLLQCTNKRDFQKATEYLQSCISKCRETFHIKITDHDFHYAAVRTALPVNRKGVPTSPGEAVYGYRWERISLYREGDPMEDEQGFLKYDPARPDWYIKVKLFDFTDKLPKG